MLLSLLLLLPLPLHLLDEVTWACPVVLRLKTLWNVGSTCNVLPGSEVDRGVRLSRFRALGSAVASTIGRAAIRRIPFTLVAAMVIVSTLGPLRLTGASYGALRQREVVFDPILDLLLD